MKNYVEPEWLRDTQEKLDELSIEGEDGIEGGNSDKDSSDEEDFFCVACDKSFKSDKAFQNHEKSKKHKENVELLKKTMKEEDLSMFLKPNVVRDEQEALDIDEESSNNNQAKEEKPKNR